MKLMTRMLALLLVCLSIVTMVVACDSGSTNNGGTANGGGGNSGLKDDKLDVNGRLKDDLPDTLNYQGEEVTILHWSNPENPEFEQEEITGDNVRDAIYDRNMQVEDRLNIDLQFVGIPGHGGDRPNFVKHVDSVYSAGTQDYDFVSVYARTSGTLAVQGYYLNLSTIENSYMDLEKPWWPQQLVETVSFGNGDYYFCSGDMSTNVLYMMHMMYINKDMFSQLQLELPYELVREGKWTIDKLIEYTSDVYRDLDNDNTTSKHDRYGFGAVHWVLDSFFAGSNLRYVDEDDNDMLVLSPDFTSKKAVRLVNKLGQWAVTDNVWVYNSAITNDAVELQRDHMDVFDDGRMLVIMQHSQYAGKHLLNADFEYGLVPNPKYDEKQVNYYTGMGNPWSLYAIFLDFDERDDRQETLTMLSAVLECWASEGYRLTTPEIFEVNMQLKYSAGQNETDMFEYIRSGITFDIGKIFAADLNNICELPSYAISANASWSSSYKSYKTAIEKKLADIVENFRTYHAIQK
ncbi:MAG: hypothetical protein E7624_01965 [Ruminococcaceae bacterium]|nr:hypothetical protein [Oscillospiraceae bacterium]